MKKNYINDIPKKLYDGLSKVFHQFGIDGNDVVNSFINSYLELAFKQSPIKNDVSLSTGFGRRYIKTYLENIKPATEIKSKTRSNHETIIILLKSLADDSKDGVIPIYGKYDSFNSIFNTVRKPSNNVSARSMIDKLIRVGIIKKIDTKHIQFVTTLPPKGLNSREDATRIFSEAIYRLCCTILHNITVKNHKDTLVQMSYWSNAINPEHYKTCTDELSEETRRYLKNCSIIIDKFEEKGLSKNVADTENIELGVSAFIFQNKK